MDSCVATPLVYRVWCGALLRCTGFAALNISSQCTVHNVNIAAAYRPVSQVCSLHIPHHRPCCAPTRSSSTHSLPFYYTLVPTDARSSSTYSLPFYYTLVTTDARPAAPRSYTNHPYTHERTVPYPTPHSHCYTTLHSRNPIRADFWVRLADPTPTIRATCARAVAVLARSAPAALEVLCRS
jgi:hypothetical protein